MSGKTFTEAQLQAIADALGDTAEGLTGSEIAHLLASSRIVDTDPSMAKRHRLYDAFVREQNQRRNRTHILAFVRRAMRPELYARSPGRFEPLRCNLNRALAFAGLAVDASGRLTGVEVASTLGEAQRRAQELRTDLLARGVHPDVLEFCRAELVEVNFFHAVLEASKSVAEKLRVRSGLDGDGATLVDRCLMGEQPALAINPLKTESEWSEQRGFANLVKGVFGMFRNPTAHTPRVNWEMGRSDAEDLLSLVSLIHRRLDAAIVATRG